MSWDERGMNVSTAARSF